MEEIAIVHHPLIGPMIQYAVEKGISQKRLFETLQLDHLQPNITDIKIKPDQFKQLIHFIRAKTGDRNFGLQVGESIRGGNLGILGFAMMNCKNFSEALDKFVHYYQLVGNITRFSVQFVDEKVKYQWLFVNKELWDYRIPILQGLIASINPLVYELTNQTIDFSSAHFCWEQPDDITEYQRIFGKKLLFGEPYTGVVFNQRYLKYPLKSPNSELLLMFETHTREKYNAIFNKKLYTNEVINILSGSSYSEITVCEIAKKMSLTLRNLQLKLKSEGTTFSQLKESIQRDLAVNHLLSGTYSIAEIGTRLGFSEPGAFYRAFKRWTGKTPREYYKPGTK